MKVSYDARALESSIDLPFDPSTVGSTPHLGIQSDFPGNPVPQDGTTKPGSLQSLRAGANTFNVRDGLPLLAEGELPE